tara:strand:+ start:294 stop:461 length:168 start_codon:yes stop_codon:yes gene_type:complete
VQIAPPQNRPVQISNCPTLNLYSTPVLSLIRQDMPVPRYMWVMVALKSDLWLLFL